MYCNESVIYVFNSEPKKSDANREGKLKLSNISIITFTKPIL